MELGNLQAGRRKLHSLTIAISALFALSLAGVAVRPSFEWREAQLDHALARERVSAREAERAQLDRFHASGGTERAQVALERLKRRVPAPLPELELHGLLRVLAERNGIVLDGLQLVAPRDAGLARLDDVAALREARLEGKSSLEGLLGLLRALRALRRPFAVLEIQLTNSEERPRTRWTIALGFFESRPPDTSFEESLAVPQEEP